MNRKPDVYLFGQVLGTHSFMLKDGFLRPDEYAEIREQYFLPGGETGTAATVLDSLWMVAQALVGLVVWFEFFFSALPAVDSNCLILLFTPLPFVWWLAGMLRRPWGGRSFYVAFVQPLTTLFYVVAFLALGQAVPLALNVLALSLLIRGATEMRYRKK